MNQFVFTGPESTGKTTLASFFAKDTNGIFVSEFARQFLLDLGREYKEKDLLTIAKKQFEIQEKAKENTAQLLFIDTDLLTIKIWSEYKYNCCDIWILDRIYSNRNAFYLLCKPDFKWKNDSLREHPEDEKREEIYLIYKNFLQKNNFQFMELEGSLENRVELVRSLLK